MHPMLHARKLNRSSTKYSTPEHTWKICMDMNMRDLSSPRKMLSHPFFPSYFTLILFDIPFDCWQT